MRPRCRGWRLAARDRPLPFICLPTLSPQPLPGGGPRSWRHVLNLGPRQSARRNNFGLRPRPRSPEWPGTVTAEWPGTGARAQEGQRVGKRPAERKLQRTSGPTLTPDPSLGAWSQVAWAGGRPGLVLVYNSEAVSMSHIPNQKLFPRIAAPESSLVLAQSGSFTVANQLRRKV